MIKRNILTELSAWTRSDSRKPLVLRGARQIGKTFVIREFAKTKFENFFELNLEKEHELRLFQSVTDARKQISILEAYFGKTIDPSNSLLFIDEIQHSKIAVQMLRYFSEELPSLPVIVAGSLLDVVLKESEVVFPVGRVQYLYMHPVTFDEFLKTYYPKNHEELSQISIRTEIPLALHDLYTMRVQEYSLIGGMPEAIVTYQKNKKIVEVDSVFQSLVQGFYDDINKYAKGAELNYIRHVLYSLPPFVGTEIFYKGFGGSNYGSREMMAAFQKLEDVGLLHRIHSSRSVALPIISNLRKRAKLIALDMGIINFLLKQRESFLGTQYLENVYKGSIAEQFVAQSLIDRELLITSKPNYWYRDKKGSTAEVDFLIEYAGALLPIEVKNSNDGFLRSMQSFIDESQKTGIACKLGVRVSPQVLKTEIHTTPKGLDFKVINLPFYLVWRVSDERFWNLL